MKSADAQTVVPAIAKTLDALQNEGRREWQRVRFYSTEKPNLDAMASYPQARLFEDRDTTAPAWSPRASLAIASTHPRGGPGRPSSCAVT
ncbi:hypothetical protein AB0F13_27815 [Streptomyces sp. NPDC026206]|uniref:hypothetical protein n=1 Tax=Streptomyces sp. NPDC026206 TaxID=3157089 RepID=UPI0033CF00DB